MYTSVLIKIIYENIGGSLTKAFTAMKVLKLIIFIILIILDMQKLLIKLVRPKYQ